MQNETPATINIKDLAPLTGIKVLIAEDNVVNQFMLSRILKEWKVDFELVSDGQSAVEALQDRHFDMLLLDTHMPVMDGYEVAKIIRTEMEEPKCNIFILSLSASSFDDEHQLALDMGMNEIMSKPFKPFELYQKMERIEMAKAV